MAWHARTVESCHTCNVVTKFQSASALNLCCVPCLVQDYRRFPSRSLTSALEQRTQQGVLPEELEFYQSYDWCLNPYVTVNEAIAHLGEEVDKLSVVPDGWQIGEIATNIFLLSSGLLNCIDEHLLGVKLRLPKRLAATFVGRGAGRFVEAISDKPWSRRRLARWREQWLSSLNDFLSLIVGKQAVARTCLAELGRRLMALLEYPFPADLQAQRLATPIAFRRLDLTQRDCLSLGDCFRAAISRPHTANPAIGPAHNRVLCCASAKSLFRGRRVSQRCTDDDRAEERPRPPGKRGSQAVRRPRLLGAHRG